MPAEAMGKPLMGDFVTTAPQAGWAGDWIARLEPCASRFFGGEEASGRRSGQAILHSVTEIRQPPVLTDR